MRGSITSPLKFKDKLHSPGRRFDFVPLLDVILIAACFMLLGSRFILAPGVGIALPQVEPAAISGMPSVAVLTLKQRNMIFFEGRVYSAKTFRAEILKEALIDAGPVAESVLLVKLGQDVDMQTFLRICDQAREAGFGAVQVAAEEALVEGLMTGG